VIDALKMCMNKTPLGKKEIFAICDIEEKVNSSGNEQTKFNSICRCTWENAVPEVILYSLYKFAENCGEYYQFTLSTLMDDGIERDGISPTRIFGLGKDDMVKILNGLTINYPEYISASFTLDLEVITLRSDKTAEDVLDLF
jgi:phosphoadenosine phosphosulfate reductase